MLIKKLFNIAAIFANEVSIKSMKFHSHFTAAIEEILYAIKCF